MKSLNQSLDLLRRADQRFDQAVRNVLDDVRSSSNPHGNLPAVLVDALDACCATGRTVESTVSAHTCLREPGFHRRVAPPPGPLKRVVSRRDFVTYHVLGNPGPSEQDEVDAWIAIMPEAGPHRFTDEAMDGWVGRQKELVGESRRYEDLVEPGGGVDVLVIPYLRRQDAS